MKNQKKNMFNYKREENNISYIKKIKKKENKKENEEKKFSVFS